MSTSDDLIQNILEYDFESIISKNKSKKNNKHNSKSSKENTIITLDDIEILKNELDQKLYSTSKKKKEDDLLLDEQFINEVIENETQKEEYNKQLRQEMYSKMTQDNRSDIEKHRDTMIGVYDNILKLNLNLLQDIHKVKQIVVNNIFKGYLDGFPQNQKNKKNILTQLKDYAYVDDCNDLKAKQYIRYINNQNVENIKLIQGGFYVRKTKKGRLLLSRNYIRFWTASPQSIIFRKLTNDEKIKSAMYELLKKGEQEQKDINKCLNEIIVNHNNIEEDENEDENEKLKNIICDIFNESDDDDDDDESDNNLE